MAQFRKHTNNSSELDDSWIDADSRPDDEQRRDLELDEVSSDISIDSHPSAANSLAITNTSSLSGAAEKATPVQIRHNPEPELIMPSVYSDISGTQKTPRRRNVPVKASPKRTSTRPQVKTSPSNIIDESANFVLEVLGATFKKLKTPLSYFFAVWLFFGILICARNLFFSSLYNAISPICRIPGVSLLGLNLCKISVSHMADERNVKFNEVIASQSHFEDILEKTAGGVGLPADMKHSEATMRDLRTLVKYSQLKSKNELELELTGFIDTARQAAWDLQRFDSRVGRAVDIVLSTTRWTQRVLEGLEAKRKDEGVIVAFLGNIVFAPFQPLRQSESALVDQYLVHMRIVREQIDSLLAEAISLLSILGNIEDRLEVVHEIATRDNVSANLRRDELLAQLWTMLGGNRTKLGSLDAQLKVLRRINHYRRTAFAQISGIIVELQKMDLDLEQLRERIGSVETIRQEGTPLWMHIESIQLGAERLEERRLEQRGIESENQRAILEGRRDFTGTEREVPQIEG